MTNHLWQSTVFAAAAALLTLAFRENRAHVRFWLWFAASVKFLVPFALLLSLSGWLSLNPKKQVAPVAVSRAVVQMSEPFSEAVPVVRRFEPRHNWTPAAFAFVWALGFLAIVAMRIASWMRTRAMVRASRLLEMGLPIEARQVNGLLEPGVYGFIKPTLLLPDDIRARLSEEKMDAVVAHELCHVRRNDNATSAIHMVVEAVFWFYPLVWWIGARMLEEREKACDEEVVRDGHRPEAYAEAILDVCRSYTRSQLECVAGISGSDLKTRIRAILAGRVLHELNFAKKIALVSAGLAAVALPIFVGVLRAQTEAPKFEVASIRVCEGGSAGKMGGRGRGGEMNKKFGTIGAATSPDRLSLDCMALAPLIRTAYVTFAGGHFNTPLKSKNPEIVGVPKWAESERYTINATSEAKPGQEMMRGPMLAALLEERFQLKVRPETRDVPVYDMTVAKGGLKLKSMPEGSCLPLVITFPPTPPPDLDGDKPMCGGGRFSRGGVTQTMDEKATNLEDFARQLGVFADRPVVDKTGVKGLFAVHLEFTPMVGGMLMGRGAPQTISEDPSDADRGPSIFTALQEVGLKLEPAKGPKDFLVVEKLERPTEN